MFAIQSIFDYRILSYDIRNIIQRSTSACHLNAPPIIWKEYQNLKIVINSNEFNNVDESFPLVSSFIRIKFVSPTTRHVIYSSLNNWDKLVFASLLISHFADKYALINLRLLKFSPIWALDRVSINKITARPVRKNLDLVPN